MFCSCFTCTYVHSATWKTHPNRQAAFAEILTFALALAVLCFTLTFVVLRFLAWIHNWPSPSLKTSRMWTTSSENLAIYELLHTFRMVVPSSSNSLKASLGCFNNPTLLALTCAFLITWLSTTFVELHQYLFSKRFEYGKIHGKCRENGTSGIKLPEK